MNTLEYEDYETTQFNLANNLKEYNQVIRGPRYAGNEAVLEGYTPARSYGNVATEEIELDGYAPAQRYSYESVNEELDSYAPASRYDWGASTEEAVLDSYAARPEPTVREAQSFRPRIMECEQILGIKSNKGLPTVEAKYELLNFNKPMAEAEVEVEAKNEVAENVEYFTRVKLNAVGMVSVVSFVAVTLLVLSFIILNAVGISAGAARIATLEKSVATQSAALESVVAGNAATKSALDATLTEGYFITNGYTEAGVTEVTLEPAPAWTPLTNSTKSTSFFDALSKFLSGIFA